MVQETFSTYRTTSSSQSSRVAPSSTALPLVASDVGFIFVVPFSYVHGEKLRGDQSILRGISTMERFKASMFHVPFLGPDKGGGLLLVPSVERSTWYSIFRSFP